MPTGQVVGHRIDRDNLATVVEVMQTQLSGVLNPSKPEEQQ
jgi:hypothetical protein